MITRLPMTVTKNQISNAALRNRLSPIPLQDASSERRPQPGVADRSSASMGTLQHLLCGCLGLSCLAGFMGVINLLIVMLYQQTADWDLYDLLWIFGH